MMPALLTRMLDVYKRQVLVEGTDAPGHAAVLRDGVPEQVAHHAVVVYLAVGVGGKIVVDDLEGLGAVVIVRIDDGEGAVEIGLCRQHGVAGAPRLDAALGDGVALSLIHIFAEMLTQGSSMGVMDCIKSQKDYPDAAPGSKRLMQKLQDFEEDNRLKLEQYL